MNRKNILLGTTIFTVILILGLLLYHQIAKNLFITYIIAGIQMGKWLANFAFYIYKKLGITGGNK